ncbi:MAG: hypothetical protein U0667_04150 [Chloroflexota bacterium]
MSAVLRRVRPDQVREITLIAVLVIMVAFFAVQIPNYLSPRTFLTMTSDASIVATVAIGQVLVLLTRNVDLSVGAIVGLVAYVVGTLISNQGMCTRWSSSACAPAPGRHPGRHQRAHRGLRSGARHHHHARHHGAVSGGARRGDLAPAP